VLLVGFLIPLAMDVKKIGDGGNSALQILLVGASLLCGALYVLLERLSWNRCWHRSSLGAVTITWWAYIAVSPLPVLLWEVQFEHYLKVLLPFVLFGVGLTVMTAVERRRIDPAVLLEILVWGALLSTVWRPIYAIAIGGVSIDTIRWQILGPGVPFLVGYGAAGLYLRRRRKLAAAVLFAALICVLLSVTRSYLIAGLLAIGGLFVTDVRQRSSMRAVRSAVKLLAILTLVGGVSVALTTFARPDFIENWIERLFHHTADSGVDITLVTRLAEYRGQFDALTQNALTILMGNGIGADYILNSRVLDALPFDIDESVGWFAGHSTWVYPFFASGVIMGVIVPLVLLAALIRGLSAASARRSGGGTDDAVLAFVIYLAYLGQSFTANIFHERYSALILGIVSGAIFIYAGRVRAKSARRVHAVAEKEKSWKHAWTPE
jgi:hypothetical protein